MMRKWTSLTVGVALTVCAMGICMTGLIAADRSFDDGPALGNPNNVADTDGDDDSESDEPVFVETPSKRATGLERVDFRQDPNQFPLIGPDTPPTPESLPSPVMDSPPVPMPEHGCDLFPCVKYKDAKKIAPCSVPMIVSVKDPRGCTSACDCCTGPKCVNVKICVPSCGCPDVKIVRNGNRVKYDYGKYVVVITSKNGRVVVDYDRRLLAL